MANRLQLKRGSGAPGTIFYEGEPVYDKSGKVLYIGDNNASGSGAGSAVASASAYSAVTEILNQASSTASGFIKLLEDTDNGNHNVSLKAPAAIASNYSLVLPDGTGSSGQVLKTDGSGNLDWVDQTSGYSGFSISDGSNTQSVESGGTVTFTAGEGIDAVVSATDTLTISAELATETNPGVATFDGTDFTVTSGDVTLNAERIQDITGAQLVTNGSHTRITATYDDANDGAIDLVVDNDLSNYDNSTSAFITAASTHTLTNKTFDADGTGNSISNLAVADFAAAAIVTESEGIGSAPGQYDSDTTLPTSAAVRDYVDAQDANIASDTLTLTNKTFDANATGNSLSNVEVADFASGVLDTDISSVSSNDDTLASAKAIKTYVDAQDSNIASDTLTLTNKTFDANGTGNSLSNVEVADLAASAVVIESEGIGSNDNDTTLPTSAAVKDYVDTQVAAVDVEFGTAGDSGTGTVNTSQSLTISGTANEIVTSASGQGITIALPDDVTIGNDLTVNGNLNVVGTAVTFSAETTRIEDRILELGLVNGAAPGSATTWDLAVSFNYNSSGAKKAGVAWLNNGFMAMLSELAESSDTGNADPQITATAYAKIAGDSLYLGGIASSNQIINSSGAAVNLVFDGGNY